MMNTSHAESKTRQIWRIEEYVRFVRESQSHFPDALGTAKVDVQGNPIGKNWSTQNDGPALEALMHIDFAFWRLDRGIAIASELFDQHLPNTSVIKRNLEFVAHHWQESTFDIWEEMEGQHLYTLKVQRDALIEGSRLCDRLHDAEAAAFYRETAVLINEELEKFKSEQKRHLLACRNQTGGSVYHKESNRDTSILLAAIHGTNEDATYGPTDSWILATFLALKRDFAQTYLINQGEPFPLFGRNVEDRYNGVSLNPTPDEQGNPWFITTFAAAELLYRAATDFRKSNLIVVDDINVEFFRDLVAGSGHNIWPGDRLTPADARFEAIIRLLFSHGEGYQRRGESYWSEDFHMNEQIHRNSGERVGVAHLTWSYGSWLSMEFRREIAQSVLALVGGG